MTDSTADSPVDPTAVSTAVSTADPTAGPAQPSQTALRAAAARAAHLIVDAEPALHRDTLAYALLGERAEELVGYHRAHGDHLVLRTARTAATTRSRFTEDRLAEAVRRGTTQYVLLGAGLDSFAYRCEPAGPLRVFEVDHPASQAAKRRCLAAAGVTEPPHVAFVPADFETASPLQRLADAGFDPGRPALVSWLGVTMYLSRTAIAAVLAEVGGLAPGTELVGDYFLPEDLRDATGQAYAEAVAPVSAELGEPWRGCLRPEEMTALLTENGFTAIRHVSTRESVEPALWRRTDGLGPHDLSRLVHARVADRRG